MARRKDRPGPLEPRSEAILRAIIEEYVATAQPVGSQTLVVKYRLGVSPATVRNVMAELESAGFLGHPHTSAGRLPTDRGYRLYVESIADAVTLARDVKLLGEAGWKIATAETFDDQVATNRGPPRQLIGS